MTQGGSPRDAHSGFIPALEAARGVAALTVALFHVSQTNFVTADGGQAPLVGGRNPTWDMQLLLPLANGHGAVIFFFVLSGFVLALLLTRRPDDHWQFATNRIFRICPAVISTIFAFVAVFLVTGKGARACRILFGLQRFSPTWRCGDATSMA